MRVALCICFAGLALNGCASQLSIRSLPPETPAADNAAAIKNAAALAAVATAASRGPAAEESAHPMIRGSA
jgi:hypothetical protein